MFKSTSTICGCKNIKYFKLLSTQAEVNCQIISDLIGVSRKEALMCVEKNKLQNKDGEFLIQSINFCKSLGYSEFDILKVPNLLTIYPIELEQHYYSLKEGGFHDITPQVLSKARTYMKRIVHYLKSIKLIPLTVDVQENLCSSIEDNSISSRIPKLMHSEEQKWTDIHLHTLKTFLMLRLDITKEEVENLFRVHKMIRNKSFKVIQQNIRLAEELGIGPKKIIKYGYLLSNYPTYPETTLRDLSNLAGMDMRIEMRRYPKLITSSPKNIIKIYGILKEFDIPDETIRKRPNVFQLSPETVKLRLQEIEKHPDLKILLTHPNVLSLIIHHNRAKTRLSFLHQMQLRCVPLTILKSDVDDAFEEYVKEGKDINKQRDLFQYLRKLFSVSMKEVKMKIQCHPFYLQVPLIDMQETYDYLKSEKFSKEHIYNVLYIILYPKNKVQSAHATIKYDLNYKYKSLSQVKKLNLMLYLIEKEHHFTGNGIWTHGKKNESVEKSTNTE
ncbi:transcription termination factor 5, mitochondrial [Diabrotica undecimpunctata]|uniref:transcription termination factor 5, mitochondrial n=1 Tax=Diabrotica undecimpunctata TaxID=50387 RepID=UPI003B63D162